MTANEADPADVAEQSAPLIEDDDAPRSEDPEADEGDIAEQARIVPDESDDER